MTTKDLGSAVKVSVERAAAVRRLCAIPRFTTHKPSESVTLRIEGDVIHANHWPDRMEVSPELLEYADHFVDIIGRTLVFRTQPGATYRVIGRRWVGVSRTVLVAIRTSPAGVK